jgi:dipeptidyl aminopeptidase/acylaminoacyl peptidase
VGVVVALLALVSGVVLNTVDRGDEPCHGPPTVAVAVDVAEGVPEVRLVGPDGSVTTIAGPVASQPAFAPDGQRVVVVAAEGDYESAGPSSTSLLAVRLDGGAPFAITPPGGQDEIPAWSPAGGTVALLRHDVTARRRAIVTVPVGLGASGEARELVAIADDERVWSLAWSPDGTRLAYVASVEHLDGSFTSTLWVVGLDGSAPRAVADVEGLTDVDWAGGDGRVLVSGPRPDQPTLVVDVASGRVDEVDRPLGGARWSRGGTHVVGFEGERAPALVEAPIAGTALGPSSELLAVEDLGEDASFAGSVGRGTAVAPCS